MNWIELNWIVVIHLHRPFLRQSVTRTHLYNFAENSICRGKIRRNTNENDDAFWQRHAGISEANEVSTLTLPFSLRSLFLFHLRAKHSINYFALPHDSRERRRQWWQHMENEINYWYASLGRRTANAFKYLWVALSSCRLFQNLDSPEISKRLKIMHCMRTLNDTRPISLLSI